MSPIYHLLYTSRRAESLTEKQLVDLIKWSADWNAQHHITGFLIEREGYFMQLIEGKEDEIITLFTRIESDPRHDDVIIQAEGTSNARLVPDWHMERVKLDLSMPSSAELLEVYRRGREALPYTHREEIMRILEQFTSAARKKSS